MPSPSNDAHPEEEVVCLEDARGDDEVQAALTLGNELFGSTDCVSGLTSVHAKKMLSSPLKERLSGTDSPKNHPRYARDCLNADRDCMIEFKPVTDTISVSVPKDELAKVLNFGITEPGNLDTSTWVKRSSRSDFVKRSFSEAKPDHFFPKHRNEAIHSCARDVECLRGERATSVRWREN